MIFLYPDDDFDLPMLEYWIVKDLDGTEMMTVEWIKGSSFPFYQLNNNKLLKSVLHACPGIKLQPTYSKDIYHLVDDELKLFEIYRKKKKIDPTGYCGKCNARGKFVRTALICPVCNAFLGGF